MATFALRLLPFAAIGVAAVLSAQAAAQSDAAPAAAPANRLESAAADVLIANATGATEEPEEITVKGRRGDELARYRLKMAQSRDKIVEVFNRENSDDDNDVKCRTEKPTGSRMGHSVCRSVAEDDATAGQAKGLLDALLYSSGNFITGARLGQPGVAGGTPLAALTGGSKATQGGTMAVYKARDELEAELKKLMEQNRQLYRAVVEYVEAKDDYNKARGAGPVIFDADHPKPQ